jgi:copper transport protein
MLDAAAPVSLATPDLWLTGIERAIMLAGLALALGGLAGRGLSRHYKGHRPGPLPAPWALRGSLVGAAASALLLITAVAGPGLAAQLARPNPPGLTSGGTAQIAAVELVLFVLAAVLLRLRRSGSAALLLSGVVIAEGIRAHPEGVVPAAGAFVTYCHVFPALLWAGMLFYAIRASIAWRTHPAAAYGILKLYATAAAWLFALVLVTGVISALVLVPLGSLFTTTYGLFLVAKAILVGVAAGLAVAGRVWLRRHPRTAGGPALATKLEIVALAAVIAITGILTVLTPPAKATSAPSTPPGQAAALLRTARIDLPGEPGPRVQFRGPDGSIYQLLAS